MVQKLSRSVAGALSAHIHSVHPRGPCWHFLYLQMASCISMSKGVFGLGRDEGLSWWLASRITRLQMLGSKRSGGDSQPVRQGSNGSISLFHHNSEGQFWVCSTQSPRGAQMGQLPTVEICLLKHFSCLFPLSDLTFSTLSIVFPGITF